MTVVQTFARYREIDGRDSMSRASIWQGNAGAYFGNNCAYADCGAATAATTSKVKTTATLPFTVGGKLFSLGATDNFWTLAGVVVAVGSFQKYALMVDDAGVATVQEATQASTAALVNWQNVTAQAKANPQNAWAPIIAMLAASRCVAAILTVATDATHTFTPGTTLLGAAGITATYSGGIDPSLMPILANERGLIAGRDF